MKNGTRLPLLVLVVAVVSTVLCTDEPLLNCDDIVDCRSCAERGICSWCVAHFVRNGVNQNNKYEVAQGGCFNQGTCGFLGRLDLAFKVGTAAGGGWYESVELSFDSDKCVSSKFSKNYHQCEDCVANTTLAGEWCYTDAMYDGEVVASGGSCTNRCLDWPIESVSFNSTVVRQASGCADPYTSQPGGSAPRMVSVLLSAALAGVAATNGIFFTEGG